MKKYILTISALLICGVPCFGSSLDLDDDSLMMDGLMIDESGGMSADESGFSVGLQGLRDFDERRPSRPQHAPQQRQGFSSGMDNVIYAEIKQHLRRANRYMKEREWSKAYESFRKAYELDKSKKAVLKKTALSAALAGQYSAADVFFRIYCSRVPNDVRMLNAWATILIKLYRFEEAYGLVQRVLGQRSDYLQGHYNLAQLAVLLEDQEVTPEQEHFWEGLNTFQAQQLLRWLQEDENFINETFTPEARITFMNSVLGEGVSGDMEVLQDTYQQLHEAIEEAEWEKADLVIARLKNYGVEHAGLDVKRARCLKNLGQIEEASRIMDQISKAYPDRAGYLMSYGALLLEERQFESARQIFENVVALNPLHFYAQFGIACALLGQNNVDQAREVLMDIYVQDYVNLKKWMLENPEYIEEHLDQLGADLIELYKG